MQENLPLSFRLRFRIEQYSQSNSAANQQLKVERSHCLVYNHRFISPRIQIHTETESCGLQSLRSQRLDSPWCSHGPVMYWIGGLSGSGLQAVEAEGVPAQGCPPMLLHLQLCLCCHLHISSMAHTSASRFSDNLMAQVKLLGREDGVNLNGWAPVHCQPC